MVPNSPLFGAAGRVAAEGQVLIRSDAGRHVVVEVNSETDFVANDENFRQFAEAVADAALEAQPQSVDALMSSQASGQSVEEARQALITKVGENIAGEQRPGRHLDAHGPDRRRR